jgi:DNA-binding beta-propeller fold protein YncE
MWNSRGRSLKSRRLGSLRIAIVTAAGLVLAASVTGADSAAAAPAAGYTASYISTAGAVIPALVAIDTVTDIIYCTGNNADTNAFELAVVDGSSREVVATVPLAGNPTGIAVDSATDTVYVAYESTVAVINGATNTVSASIALPAGAVAGEIAVDSTTNTLYVNNDSASVGGVVVIDGSTNTVSMTVSSGGTTPDGIAIDEATDVVWVANRSGTVVAISGSTGSIIESVSPTGIPNDIAVDQDTNTVYVSTASATSGLTVIDGATGDITATVPVELASLVAVDQSADVVFAQAQATYGGSTSYGTVVIDGTTNAVTDVLGADGAWSAIDPATSTLYETMGPDGYAGYPGLWAITPSATNGVSPLAYGVTNTTGATASVGTGFDAQFAGFGEPVPTFTETGPLPSGLTMYPNGFLLGTPAVGTQGTYPITVIASNGIAPDYSIPFTLTVEQQQQPYEVQASQQSGFCLDNAGGSSADGNPIQVWSCLGNANQGWLYVPQPGGVAGAYELENSNGMCLDDPGDAAVNGTRVQLWSCLGDASQTWTQVAADGSFTEYVNANGLCLDNTGNGATDGNRVQVWACTGDAAQHWFGPGAQSSAIPPAYPVRADQQSGFCLDNAGGSSADGNLIQIWTCFGEPNQAWKYVPSVNGVTGDYQLENSNGLCLDDPGDSAVDGTRVQLWACLGDPSQTWNQLTVGSYAEYVNANGLCLDNTGNALTNGNRVQVWACNGDLAQQWFGPSPQSGT